MLGSVEGARVLDLFAGSGALGIEALSRGAGSAVFVDSAVEAVAAVRRNLAAVGAEAEVLHLDALRYLRSAPSRARLYDLVFLDPPYAAAPDIAEKLGSALPAVLAPGARLVAETARGGPALVGLPVLRERLYGDTLIRIHESD